jgi:Na+/proline symporter
VDDKLKEFNMTTKRIYLVLFSVFPIICCAASSLYYNEKNTDTGLATLFVGLFIICFFGPLYLSVLSCYHHVKNNMDFNFCVKMCMIIILIVNFIHLYNMVLISGWDSNLFNWNLPFNVCSIAVMAIFLLLAKFISKKLILRRNGV